MSLASAVPRREDPRPLLAGTSLSQPHRGRRRACQPAPWVGCRRVPPLLLWLLSLLSLWPIATPPLSNACTPPDPPYSITLDWVTLAADPEVVAVHDAVSFTPDAGWTVFPPESEGEAVWVEPVRTWDWGGGTFEDSVVKWDQPGHPTVTVNWTVLLKERATGEVVDSDGPQSAAADIWVVGVKKLLVLCGSIWEDVGGSNDLVLKGTGCGFKAVRDPETSPDWPSGKPVWGGSSGASGSSEVTGVMFYTVSSSSADYKTVTASCGNTVTANEVVFDMTGILTPADNFAGRSLVSYGLKEIVNLSYSTSPTGVSPLLEWKKTSGVGYLDLGTGTYDAGGTEGAVILRLEVTAGPSKGEGAPYCKFVMAPSGTRMTKASQVTCHVQYSCTVAMKLYYWLTPANVSFSNLEFGEGTCPAENVEGILVGHVAAHPDSWFGAILPGASDANGNPLGCRVATADYPGIESVPPPFTPNGGSFSWSIPTLYNTLEQEEDVEFGDGQEQVMTVGSTGSATVTKGGEVASAAFDDPTVTAF